MAGLDVVLGGGLLPGSCTLVSGAAGTGKTTLGLQFLCSDAALGEGGVYFTFEEFPEQIYRDAAAFGWDIPALEEAGKLQVICLAPETLLQEAESVGGLFEELQAEIGMRRAVVDSLNLLHLAGGSEENQRQLFYRLRNAFRRLNVTTLFLHEWQSSEADAGSHEFVADSVVQLTYDNLEGHRLRHVEVRKHRGSAFLPGQHVFVFDRSGLKILPALNRIPDLQHGLVVPTGMARLDECLGGGFPRGTAFVLNVNSKCNYRYLQASLVAAHLRAGGCLISGPSTTNTIADIVAVQRLYGVDLLALGRAGGWCALNYEGHPTDAELAPYIIKYETGEEGRKRVSDALRERILSDGREPREWLMTLDLNTVILSADGEAMAKEWVSQIAAARHFGMTVIAVCNFAEMGEAMGSFVQRTASGILRTWFDGRYQYLQVQKAPNGRMSEPMVVEYIGEPPFMALW